LRTDGQTDGGMEKNSKAFSNFSKVPAKGHSIIRNIYKGIKNQIFNKLPSLLQVNYLSSQFDNDTVLISQLFNLNKEEIF
jgi:hypothetical protein